MYEELEMFDGIFKKILRNVGVPEQDCERMMSGDVYLNAGEAISLGIMDSIENDVI